MAGFELAAAEYERSSIEYRLAFDELQAHRDSHAAKQ
jgi:hypothetical protein